MQAVERANAELRAVAAGQIGAEIESILRQKNFMPQPGSLNLQQIDLGRVGPSPLLYFREIPAAKGRAPTRHDAEE